MDSEDMESGTSEKIIEDNTPSMAQNGNISNTTDTATPNSSSNTDNPELEVSGDNIKRGSTDSGEGLNLLERRDTVIECTEETQAEHDGSETTDGDTEHVDLEQLQLDDETPAQETVSEAYNYEDNVSNDELNSEREVDENRKVLEKTQSYDRSGYASDSSFSRGGSIVGSEADHLLTTDNFSDSSGYTDDQGPGQCSPFDSPVHGASNVDANGSVINRPDSLSLPRPLQFYERQRLSKKDSTSSISSYSSKSSRSSSMDALIEVASSTPLQTQGKVTRDGDMLAFVNDSLQEMIKRSSPLTKSSGSQTPSARSVSSMSSSASGWSVSNSSVSGYSYSGISRSPSIMNQSPEDIPPIDPKAVADLEIHAKKVAESLDVMMKNLQTNLHKMSSITYACVDAYKDGVDGTCDSVDASIKAMYALMAKCEELSKATRPIYELQEQIKEIKRLLDLFEAQIA